MTDKETEPEVIYSKLCQDLMVDGHGFTVNIISTDQNPDWCLEVIDENGLSHCWEAVFETDGEAFEAALIAFEDEGAAGFLQPASNVVQFPSKDASTLDDFPRPAAKCVLNSYQCRKGAVVTRRPLLSTYALRLVV